MQTSSTAPCLSDGGGKTITTKAPKVSAPKAAKASAPPAKTPGFRRGGFADQKRGPR